MPIDVPQTLSLRVGQVQELRLPVEGGGAGYGWSAEVADGDVVAATIGGAGGMPGPPGQASDQMLVIRGLAPGHARIVLRLRRPWKPEQELDRGEIEVEVAR